MSELPRVVIIGRPNVGKSTLFNRITGRRRALVGNEPGMTRDRLYAPAEWQDKQFEIVDTGGMVPAEKDLIVEEIFRQAEVAIEEAAQLVLVVDGRQGVVPLDEELARLLRRVKKPVSLAVNKIDSPQHTALTGEFHRLGVKSIFPLSAEHGLGVDELLEHVTADFPATVAAGVIQAPEWDRRVGSARKERRDAAGGNDEESPQETATQDHVINVAIIGRPNVGKSTLLNSLLDEERSIVTPLPGTTRDAVDAEVERDGLRFRFVDTAGIRRKGKTELLAEKLSVIQARKHLERSDVALLLIDALEGLTALDTHIGGYAHESRRSVVIVVNKWDAVKKGPKTTEEFTEKIRRRMKYLDYAPLVFISAIKGQRLGKLIETIVQVAAARRERVPTAEMNRFLAAIDLELVPSPSRPGGRRLRVYYLTQAGTAPPTFIAFTNRSGKLHFSVERYLVNRIRERFGFVGTPIVIKSRAHK
jgi:GTP-binding protein